MNATHALSASPYQRWHSHFLGHHHDPRSLRSLPWDDPYLLSEPERRAAASSIQQFQLGEWARGRGLMERASCHPVLGSDPWFLPALRLFIAEEQGHSGMLGCFLDRERLPRLRGHWVDGTFRRLRKFAGLEVCLMVLVTAEVFAVPFYEALRDATRSGLLRAICRLILCDEAAHLHFQALTIGLLRHRAGAWARRVRAAFHRALFCGTAMIVWQQHRKVFLRAGWGFRRYWDSAGREFARLGRRINRVAAGPGEVDDVEALRLD